MHTAMQIDMRMTHTNACKAIPMFLLSVLLAFLLFLLAPSISPSSPHYRCRTTTYKQGQELQTHGHQVCRPKQASIMKKNQ
mmetsp:Transcript_53079/g.85908  ORF Transcript_53079/g.85908 Transcript_53079/m.85908 type:complete len:81 (+) Transcript_53079:182-424(+)